MRRLVVVAVAVLASSCAPSTQPPAREQGYSDDDIEYQLAVVAGEGFTDASVEPYDAGLDAAERVCTESRERIADIVVRASQLADERSLDMPILDLLVALPQAVPAELWPTDCADIAAALVVLAGG